MRQNSLINAERNEKLSKCRIKLPLTAILPGGIW
jgi:hypothetical protein